MNKAIERVETYKNRVIEKELEKLNASVKKAREELNATGYSRYQKKIDKAEAEINEIEKYMNTKPTIQVEANAIAELRELQHLLRNIKSKIEYILCDMPISADTIGLKDLLREIGE